MSDNDKLQEQLAEALEHHEDHPVTKEEDYEIPEDVLLLMELQEKMRKSKASFDEYMKRQDEIWGKLDENNK